MENKNIPKQMYVSSVIENTREIVVVAALEISLGELAIDQIGTSPP